jgi:hypothetical protein
MVRFVAGRYLSLTLVPERSERGRALSWKVGCFVMVLKDLLFLTHCSVPPYFHQTAIKVPLKLQSRPPNVSTFAIS